jgi:hypothetical protein
MELAASALLMRSIPLMCVVAVTCLALARDARAGAQVPIATMRVVLPNGAIQEFDGASADGDWMRSWLGRPLERREVLLQGRASGANEASRFRAIGCTLGETREAAVGYEAVTLQCAIVLRAD